MSPNGPLAWGRKLVRAEPFARRLLLSSQLSKRQREQWASAIWEVLVHGLGPGLGTEGTQALLRLAGEMNAPPTTALAVCLTLAYAGPHAKPFPHMVPFT